MEIYQSFWFWIVIIAVAGIIGAAVTNAVDKSSKTKIRVAELQSGGDYKKVADDAAGTNAQLLERLTAVESRLASIEKTLTDIP